MDIRLLKANEIDCRVGQISEKGLTLLLYKDARVDMAILDELFTPFGWQRKHFLVGENLYCEVSIYDKEKGLWVAKTDVGTESMTEQEKGQSSDSFKRACVNVGIGRELYTAPFIWIVPLDEKEIYKNNKGKLTTNTSFVVSEIEYDADRTISKLVICDDKGNLRYTYPRTKTTPKKEKTAVEKKEVKKEEPKEMITPEQVKLIHTLLAKDEERHQKMMKHYGVSSSKELSKAQATECIKILKGEK